MSLEMEHAERESFAILKKEVDARIAVVADEVAALRQQVPIFILDVHLTPPRRSLTGRAAQSLSARRSGWTTSPPSSNRKLWNTAFI